MSSTRGEKRKIPFNLMISSLSYPWWENKFVKLAYLDITSERDVQNGQTKRLPSCQRPGKRVQVYGRFKFASKLELGTNRCFEALVLVDMKSKCASVQHLPACLFPSFFSFPARENFVCPPSSFERAWSMLVLELGVKAKIAHHSPASLVGGFLCWR